MASQRGGNSCPVVWTVFCGRTRWRLESFVSTSSSWLAQPWGSDTVPRLPQSPAQLATSGVWISGVPVKSHRTCYQILYPSALLFLTILRLTCICGHHTISRMGLAFVQEPRRAPFWLKNWTLSRYPGLACVGVWQGLLAPSILDWDPWCQHKDSVLLLLCLERKLTDTLWSLCPGTSCWISRLASCSILWTSRASTRSLEELCLFLVPSCPWATKHPTCWSCMLPMGRCTNWEVCSPPGRLADGPLGFTVNMVMALWFFSFLKITFNSLPYLRTLVTDTASPPFEVGRGAEIRKYLSSLTKELRKMQGEGLQSWLNLRTSADFSY